MVDAAVLNGLKAPSSQRVALAETQTRSAVISAGLTLDQLSFASTPNQGLRGRVKVRLPSIFGNLLGLDGIDIAAGSEGFLKTAPGPAGTVCLMLMDPSAAETLRVNGGAAVKAPNCEVHVQTSANIGALFNGNASFDVKRICLKGPGYIANGRPKLGTVETACKTAGDPFAGRLPAPPSLACGFTNRVFEAPKGKPATELEPGVYCGNTSFNGNQSIVFKPGLYVIRDGAMTIDGGSSIAGAGVTIFLADAGASLRLNGHATTQLAAPASGPYEGVLMFEPSGLARSNFAFNGGAGHRLNGLIYLPSRNLVFNGASTVNGDHHGAQLAQRERRRRDRVALRQGAEGDRRAALGRRHGRDHPAVLTLVTEAVANGFATSRAQFMKTWSRLGKCTRRSSASSVMHSARYSGAVGR